ncbi:MAG: hypothetical protein ABEJ23_09260 [Haloarculaceae archaeon]
MSRADLPEWPALAGWLGVVLAMLWLAEPSAASGPVQASTLLLLACWGYGVARLLAPRAQRRLGVGDRWELR